MEPTNQPPTQDNDQPEPTVGIASSSSTPAQRLKRNKPVLIGLLALGLLAVILLVLTLTKPAKSPSDSVDVSGTNTVETRQATVTITKDGFTPATLTIKAGTKVTWTNTDSAEHAVASDPHPTHTGLKGLESTNLSKDGTYSFTFDKPGTYTYHDHLDPFTLKGTVVVE